MRRPRGAVLVVRRAQPGDPRSPRWPRPVARRSACGAGYRPGHRRSAVVAVAARRLRRRQRRPARRRPPAAAHPLGQGGPRAGPRLRAVERVLPAHRRRRPGRPHAATRWAWSSTARPAPSSAGGRATSTETDYLRGQVQNMAHFIRARRATCYVIGMGGGQRRRVGPRVRAAVGHRRPRSTATSSTSPTTPSATTPASSTSNPASPSSTTMPAATSPARTGTFDLIQISLIDTWAATVGRRLRADRELALHDRGVGAVPRPPRRRAVSYPSRASSRRRTRPARPSTRSRPTAPSRWPPRSSTDRGVEDPRHHILIYTPARRYLRRRPGQRDGERRAVHRTPTWPSSARRRPAAGSRRAHARLRRRPDARTAHRPRRTRAAALDDVRGRHLAAHRRPAVLLPDGRHRAPSSTRPSSATTTPPARC